MSIPDDDVVQATFQQLQCPPSSARPRLLRDTVQQLLLHRGRLSLVTGQSGQGKTAFLVQSLRPGQEEGRPLWAAGGRGGGSLCM